MNGEAPRRTVRIPARAGRGKVSVRVTVPWVCPSCGAFRGDPFATVVYDGSRRLAVDGWVNQCGHVDEYDAVRAEAVQGATA